MRRHPAALSGTRRHSAPLSGTQWHSATLSGTQWHSATLSGLHTGGHSHLVEEEERREEDGGQQGQPAVAHREGEHVDKQPAAARELRQREAIRGDPWRFVAFRGVPWRSVARRKRGGGEQRPPAAINLATAGHREARDGAEPLHSRQQREGREAHDDRGRAEVANGLAPSRAQVALRSERGRLLQEVRREHTEVHGEQPVRRRGGTFELQRREACRGRV